jgi:Tfp pilus assembly protein PilF
MKSSSHIHRWLALLNVLCLLCVATTVIAQPRPRPGSVPTVPPRPAPVAPPKAPAPVVPQPPAVSGPTTPAPATPVPSKSTTEPATTVPATKADSGFGYRDQLIITRVTVTPAYGQGGAKPLPLKAGTVLQVKEERVVDNELYLQTLGGVLRVKDVILLNKAYETLSQELKLAEKDNKPITGYLYLRGLVLHKQGSFDRAADEFTQAMATETELSELLLIARAESRIEAGKYADALEDCQAALKLDPQSAAALTTLAWVQYEQGQLEPAFKTVNQALTSDANHAEAYLIRSWLYDAQGKASEAKADLEKVLQLEPLSASARNSLAWLMATSNKADIYKPKDALVLARAACEWDAYRSAEFLDTLSAALAANGDFEQAVKIQTSAIKIAAARELPDFQKRLALYQQKQAFRQGP